MAKGKPSAVRMRTSRTTGSEAEMPKAMASDGLGSTVWREIQR